MPIDAYVAAVQAEAARGNATEHTFRPALKALLESLDTGIAATNEPRRIACGAPDYQVARGNLPVGHVEAKDLHVDLDKEARSGQMARYLKALPNLILTNYLDFRWFVNGELREEARIGRRDRNGKVVREPQGEMDLNRLLKGFLSQQPPVVGTPRDLALRLAELAPLTRGLIAETFKREDQRGELHEQFDAFRKALIPGLDADEFADMYAQTLAYGLFAARVAQPTAAAFTRYSAAQLLPKTNPFLSKLFYEIAGPDLDDRIAWAVDDIAALLARADMSEILRNFGKRTRQEDPVVHFYETFLAAYDPKMRESRGVYYTPEPVVSFIVRSVDHLLRTRFGKALGLADQDTLILDPATGTATFLYFVVEQIYETLRQNGLESGWNSYVGDGPRSLLRRLFGFELLMAPYAVAHLKLGLQLQEKGYDFGRNERLGVYLTNALDEGVPAQTTMPFARYIADESAAAAEVKSSKPIMVVLGNPPYSNFGGMNKGEWILDLLEDYKKDLNERKINLDDDYIKFIRFGQWKIEQAGEGILAFISNNSYIDGITHRRMRESLMNTFTEIYILDLHGNVKRREKSPDGSKDENVFDIQQGVAIALFVKQKNAQTRNPKIRSFDLWGNRQDKYTYLLSNSVEDIDWIDIAKSENNNFFAHRPMNNIDEYNILEKISNIMPLYSSGIQTKRDKVAISYTRLGILEVMEYFRDNRPEDVKLRFDLPEDGRDWDVVSAANHASEVLASGQGVAPILYRIYDKRWSVIDQKSKGFVAYPRFDVMQHMQSANLGLISTRQLSTSTFQHIWVAEEAIDGNSISLQTREYTYIFPLYLYPSTEKKQSQASLFDDAGDEDAGPGGRRANLSAEFIADLTGKLGAAWVPDGRGTVSALIPQPPFGPAQDRLLPQGEKGSKEQASTVPQGEKGSNSLPSPAAGRGAGGEGNRAGGEGISVGPEDVFHYAYAVFHSPTYRSRYAELLKIDFPRLPLTGDPALFADLAALGAELVDLHLLRLPGQVPPGAVGGNGGHPALAKLRTRFQGGGANIVEKIGYDAADQRVYISKTSYFEGIDPATWEFRVGGYQVLDKWLKDRKGRPLSFDDLLHYQRVYIALAETRRVMAAIDARIGAWPIE